MRFVFLVEGETEAKCLPEFIPRWLRSRLSRVPGVDAFPLGGWARLRKEQKKHAKLHLADSEVIAVVSLMDLYGPDFYPDTKTTAEDRCAWAKAVLEREVGEARFRQFFAVHETEAWILSDPGILDRGVRDRLPKAVLDPEKVNFNEPPAKLLERLYLSKTRRSYKKTIRGPDLFTRLDPEIVYQKCPHFKQMMDDMLELAKAAGLE